MSSTGHTFPPFITSQRVTDEMVAAVVEMVDGIRHDSPWTGEDACDLAEALLSLGHALTDPARDEVMRQVRARTTARA